MKIFTEYKYLWITSVVLLVIIISLVITSSNNNVEVVTSDVEEIQEIKVVVPTTVDVTREEKIRELKITLAELQKELEELKSLKEITRRSDEDSVGTGFNSNKNKVAGPQVGVVDVLPTRGSDVMRGVRAPQLADASGYDSDSAFFNV